MDTWWIVVVLIVLAAIAVLYLAMQKSRRGFPRDPGSPAADRNFVEDRETSRLNDMSEEDRAWQAASLEKEQTSRDRNPPA